MVGLLKKMIVLTTAVLGLVLGGASPASAAPVYTGPQGKAATPVGNDISWPQCTKPFPKGQAFGIVGVNKGLANNTNPCLAAELEWARGSLGGTSQPLVSLYVNTANPGLAGSWWPTSNTYADTEVFNPYGTCDGRNTAACAYIYGYAKAYDDAQGRGVTNPSAYLWWLDVETGNSWQADKTANVADLEGMTAYFQSIGARVGLYSTGYQWGQIAGTVPAGSRLNGLPSWLAGARSLAGAKANCSLPGLTAGSSVSLTQYVSGGYDYDYSCP